MDAISHLPDDVLGQILSFLSTKQAASTSVLSKRWRNVFVLVSNIELNYFDSVHKDRLYRGAEYLRNFIDFVEKLLNLQGNTPIKKFTLMGHDSVKPSRVQSWISNVLERGAMDLDLDIIMFPNDTCQPVPWLTIKSKTLVKLRLGRGVTIKFCQDDYLPMLKTLFLDSVSFYINYDVVETLLSRCPVLEDLVIQEHRRIYRTFYVDSPSLKRLDLRFYHTPIIRIDAPNLVYFSYKFAACGCCYRKEKISICLPSSRVKMLEISGYKGTKRDLNQIEHFLEKLPYLELVKVNGRSYLQVDLITIPFEYNMER